MRIHIIGTSGSGKTTLARQLAGRLHCRHIELDVLYWTSHWTHISHAEFIRRIEQPLTEQAWLIDGEYCQFNPAIWPKTDLLVWLDYPLPIVLWRLVQRGIGCALTKRSLWDSGNRESLTHFFGQHSIMWKALRSHEQRRKAYSHAMTHPRFAHMNFLRFRTPQATINWLHAV